jgi:FKBP-type peptidyl-prolyl cis-trans isomerase FkpA
MATKKSQRIGIWVIAVALTVGTLGGFLVMVLAPKNQATDQARYEVLQKEYQEEHSAYQAKLKARDDKIAAELSPKYYDTFKQYESRVAAFDAGSVTELAKEDLLNGDGEELTSDSTFFAYYIGWNPSGKVFDGSIEGDALKMPLEVIPGSVIEGWTEGVAGMKVGGVRELTIPADKAYGDQAQGEDIPANTPLKFIIMIIPSPDRGEEIAAPKMPEELKKLYAQINGIDPSMLEGM